MNEFLQSNHGGNKKMHEFSDNYIFIGCQMMHQDIRLVAMSVLDTMIENKDAFLKIKNTR